MTNAKRIETLQRRAEWLEARTGTYDAAERSALLWAIPILQEHIASVGFGRGENWKRLHFLALAVACPQCGARDGVPCMNLRTGDPITHVAAHDARLRLAGARVGMLEAGA